MWEQTHEEATDQEGAGDINQAAKQSRPGDKAKASQYLTVQD